MIAVCLEPYRRYADFSGRTSRRDFWLYQLGYVLFLCMLGLCDAAASAVIGEDLAEGVFVTAFFVFIAGSALPRIALTVRRLHDRGQGGTTYLWTLIPYVGWIVWIILGCRESDRVENGWGPGPDDDPELMKLFA
ncbi:DUF805 domain-containing protein [Novosphingobium resinovorum]|uniref:DUF805 domain-containing protein n=1 Tax=Novosphingobium resinovorum TaxID=158500 RepID=UPI002ECFFE2F|nr:DUF805 domain-containing protein [Novosphingobium resinovorum]